MRCVPLKTKLAFLLLGIRCPCDSIQTALQQVTCLWSLRIFVKESGILVTTIKGYFFPGVFPPASPKSALWLWSLCPSVLLPHPLGNVSSHGGLPHVRECLSRAHSGEGQAGLSHPACISRCSTDQPEPWVQRHEAEGKLVSQKVCSQSGRGLCILQMFAKLALSHPYWKVWGWKVVPANQWVTEASAICEEMDTQEGHAWNSRLWMVELDGNLESCFSFYIGFPEVTAKLVTERCQCSHTLLLGGWLSSHPHHLIFYFS